MFFSQEKAISKKNEQVFEHLSFTFESKLKNKESCIELIRLLSKKISLDMLFNNQQNSEINDFKELFNDTKAFGKKIDLIDISTKDTAIIPLVNDLDPILNNGLKNHKYNVFKEKGFVQTSDKWNSLGINDEFGDEIVGGYLADVNLSVIWEGGDTVAVGNILYKTRLRNNQNFNAYFPTDSFLNATINHEYIQIEGKKYFFDVDFLMLFKLIQQYYKF